MDKITRKQLSALLLENGYKHSKKERCWIKYTEPEEFFRIFTGRFYCVIDIEYNYDPNLHDKAMQITTALAITSTNWSDLKNLEKSLILSGEQTWDTIIGGSQY